MKLKYTLLNAFTQRHFNGAQIAVFSQADEISEYQKIQLAKELNLSETVFISRSKLSGCDARIEVYTPEGRGDFAGHAIVAASYLMADSGLVQGTDARLEFEGQSLDIVHSHKNKKVQINIPVSEKYDEYVPSNQELAQIIGVDESLLGYLNYKPMISGCPQSCLMIPLKNNAALRKAQFYENKWQLSFVASLANHVLLFTGDHPYESINFTARLMGKNIAIDDDPPIGSVAPAFGLYLAYGIDDYHRSCLIQRGEEQSRISVMEVNIDKQAGKVDGIQLGGHAIKIAEGFFDIPDE